MRSDFGRQLFAAAGFLLACSLLSSPASPLLTSPLLGISPQDKKHYSGAIIACKDGSKSFPRNRLNDNYCDCPDGTDEPGTSACPESKFYCRNVGDVPLLLFSSRVNDHICDCCDGSDEYDGGLVCQNTCLNNGAESLKTFDGHHSTEAENNQLSMKEKKIQVDPDDLVQNLKGLRIITVVELASLMALLILVCLRTRVRRRHCLWRNWYRGNAPMQSKYPIK